MPEIVIRECQKTDEEGVLNVCYKTGYMGEDLTGTNKFNDIKLFGYLFCLYYLRFETKNCFVAVDKSNDDKIAGYILGTLDSRKQEKQFAMKMLWKIISRVLFLTSWRYNESFRSVLYFLNNLGPKQKIENLYEEYPAHLHINVLPEYQHLGIGSKLLSKFEEHLRTYKVPGVHLATSNRNVKAIPFYHKKGYELILEQKTRFWKGVDDYKNLIFVKKL